MQEESVLQQCRSVTAGRWTEAGMEKFKRCSLQLVELLSRKVTLQDVGIGEGV